MGETREEATAEQIAVLAIHTQGLANHSVTPALPSSSSLCREVMQETLGQSGTSYSCCVVALSSVIAQEYSTIFTPFNLVIYHLLGCYRHKEVQNTAFCLQAT